MSVICCLENKYVVQMDSLQTILIFVIKINLHKLYAKESIIQLLQISFQQQIYRLKSSKSSKFTHKLYINPVILILEILIKIVAYYIKHSEMYLNL